MKELNIKLIEVQMVIVIRYHSSLVTFEFIDVGKHRFESIEC